MEIISESCKTINLPKTRIADSLNSLVDSGEKFGTIYVDPPWKYFKDTATWNHSQLEWQPRAAAGLREQQT